ncbi:MAG: lysozyme inhibitor LprI family protein [Pseudomonadota bacterium]
MGAQIFLPVSAASFDCKKAVSEVEKLICQNPELSRLDDEMTRMYKKALASAPDKPLPASDGRDWLKKEQRGWLRYTRNACTTATCLKPAYESQIITLTLGVQPDQKIRRHPDVWGAELPTDATGRAEEARIFEDHLGRIQVLYAFNTATERIYRAYSFFDKAILAEWRSERDGNGGSEQQAENIEILERIKNYEKEQVAYLLADERVNRMESYGFEGATGVLAEHLPKLSPFIGWPPCTYGLRSLLSAAYTTPQGQTRVSLTLIRIYPEPQPMDPELKDTYPCSARYGYRLRGRGVNIVMANLHDGTFLIKDKGYPLVIRFRPNLESPYLRERDDLFLVPADDMMRWFDEKSVPDAFDQLVVEKLTGNK